VNYDYSGTDLEGEGNDRSSLNLPGHQQQLLEDVMAYGKFIIHFVPDCIEIELDTECTSTLTDDHSFIYKS